MSLTNEAFINVCADCKMVPSLMPRGVITAERVARIVHINVTMDILEIRLSLPLPDAESVRSNVGKRDE